MGNPLDAKNKPASQRIKHHDNLLIGLHEMSAITPFSYWSFAHRFSKYLQDNHYIIRDSIRGKTRLWGWESLIKAGIIRALAAERERKLKSKGLRPKWYPNKGGDDAS